MTQLAAAVNSTEELWTLDTLPTTQYVSVDDETVEVRASFPSQIFSLTGAATAPQIRVHRGVGGTTAASHLINAALTPVYGLGGGGGGDGGSVLSASVTLTDAQIKALPTALAELAPAPGAGQMLYPLGAVLVMRSVAIYTNRDAALSLGLIINGWGVRSWSNEVCSTFLSWGPNSVVVLPLSPVNEIVGGNLEGAEELSQFENQALTLGCNNGVLGDFTGGNAANTMDVTVQYSVVAV
jgi:hypothetical protein